MADLYCDVDDTIIDWDYRSLKTVGTDWSPYKPNYEVIDALEKWVQLGEGDLYIWSGTGYYWAVMQAKRWLDHVPIAGCFDKKEDFWLPEEDDILVDDDPHQLDRYGLEWGYLLSPAEFVSDMNRYGRVR